MSTDTPRGLPEGHFVEIQELITHRVHIRAGSEEEALKKARWMAWEGMLLVRCKEVSTSIITFNSGGEDDARE